MVTRHNIVLWLVIMWFAVLQTITPFIHAHLEADQSTQSHGLHIHEPGILDLPDLEHTLKNVDVPMHVVGVNLGLFKSFDMILLPLFCVWFVLCLPLLRVQRLKPSLSHHHLLPIYLRTRSRPRAPPTLNNH